MAKQEGKFWDVVELIEKRSGSTYRDWEGFADPVEAVRLVEPVLEILPEGPEYSEYRNAVLDIVTNIIFEWIDEGGEVPSSEVVFAIGHTVDTLLRVRFWRRSGGKWELEYEEKEPTRWDIRARFVHPDPDIGTVVIRGDWAE